VQFYTKNGLGATYDVHLRLIGKRVADFLLVLIELFSLGVMAEAIRASIGSKSVISLQWGRLTKNFRQRVASTNHSFSQKTRLNDLLYDIKIWTDLYSVLSQCTRLADERTDGQTDGQTDNFFIASLRWHFMQRGKTIPFIFLFIVTAIVRVARLLTSQMLALCPNWLYFTVEWIRGVNATLYHASHPL